MDVGNELSTFAQFTAKSRVSGFPEEQALSAATQEIVDLYNMLRHKGRQEGPREAAANHKSNPAK